MKKVFLFIMTAALIFAIFITPSFAANDSFLPESVDAWGFQDHTNDDGSVIKATVEVKDGKTIVGGSVEGSWPSVLYTPDESNWVTIPADGSIILDITIESGYSNITLYFKGEAPNSTPNAFYISIFNLIDSLEAGAGGDDLPSGKYNVSITLDKLKAHSKFNANCLNDDGSLTVSGLRIYSVGGGKVTINQLGASDTQIDPTTSSETEESQPTNTESSIPPIENSTNNESNVSVNNSPAETNNNGDSIMIYYIIGGVAAVVIIGVVIFFVIKKKK